MHATHNLEFQRCVGIVARDGERVTADEVRRMADTIVHRGSGDEGIYAERNVGLGVPRLSIIDLALKRQPIYNEDHSVCAVFKRSDNLTLLRQDLEKPWAPIIPHR